jgi:hypothetical protein
MTRDLDAEFQKIVFATHARSECAATRAAIKFAQDEIKLAMREAYELGRAHEAEE